MTLISDISLNDRGECNHIIRKKIDSHFISARELTAYYMFELNYNISDITYILPIINICLIKVLRPTLEMFTDMETSLLPVKGFKF